MKSIFTELEQIKINYDKTIQLAVGLPFSQKETIRMVDFYSNSRYLNRQIDELGLDKPFYNIVNAMCDVENAAKDIDTKDIGVTSDDPEHYTASFLMSKDIYEWMKEVNFAKDLNDMRDTDTRYGSLLVKKCIYTDDDGKKQFKIEIPEWKNVITDQVDIENSPIVEVHFMSATDLKKMTEWDQTAIKEVIKKMRKAKITRTPVFEIRGEFPKSYITELENEQSEADIEDTDFSYQLYYIAGELSGLQQGNESAQTIDFTSQLTPLYWEDDTERVYKYKARKRKAGRDFGVGVVEEGEQAQISTNDAILSQTRAMRYTSKVIGQTASKKLKGRNMLTEVDDGYILEHEDGKPITPLQLLPSGGLNQYQNVLNQWYTQFERTTSSFNAQRGEAQGDVPFRAQALQLQQSGSVFQDLQEDMGIFIVELFTDKGWIMDFLAKRINTEHILAHEFSMDELKEIDKSFATDYANRTALNMILSGKIVSADDYASFMQIGDDTIKKTKTSRFLQVPKDYYKKFKSKVTVNVTGEQRNKAAVMESLFNMIDLYSKNPNISNDPVLTELFMKAVELSGSGISPVSLVGAIQEQQKKVQEQQQAQMEQAQQPGGQPAPGGQPQPLSLAANPLANAQA